MTLQTKEHRPVRVLSISRHWVYYEYYGRRNSIALVKWLALLQRGELCSL
jgi:hypothetical protein